MEKPSWIMRYLLPVFRVITHLCFLLFYYTCFRALFIVFNSTLVKNLDIADLATLFLQGLRFDLSIILVLNSLWILLALATWPSSTPPLLRKTMNVIFVFINGIAFAFESSDWIYFQFNHKRATVDILDMISRKGDFLILLPEFLKQYWYILLLTIGFICLMSRCYILIEKKWANCANKTILPAQYAGLIRISLILLYIPLIILGIRGGTQLVPLNIRNAVEVAEPRYAAIVLNTPFSIINSWQGHKLKEVYYMPTEEAWHIARPVKQYHTESNFRVKNVVFLVLESFSKEFTKLGSGESYTPFLDSLMDKSLTFTSAYANSLRSNEAIPAILSGIPGLLEEPVTTSVYSNNHYTALPALLKDYAGYHTAFFHGCTNGTMSFDIFARLAGFDQYYGRSEYGNERDYDGSWGIFDEPFLQFFAKQLKQMPEPFNVVMFTATSHNPYPIPAQYKDKFPKGSLPIHETIGYTDYALSRFFETVKNERWYNNSLFIITADHCAPVSADASYYNGVGKYQIPIMFFAPGDTSLRGYNHTLIQQIDLLPSVLDYLGYSKPFYALGNSVFDPGADRFVLNCLSTVYEWINNGYRLKIADSNILEAYHYPSDSLSLHNIASDFAHLPHHNHTIRLWQALVQVYTDGIIHNRMHVETVKKQFPNLLKQE